MAYVPLIMIVLSTLLFIHCSDDFFTPDRDDNNAYGMKIAMNDVVFVQVHQTNNPPKFLVRFAPYNSTQKSLQCSISIPDLYDHYIYSLAISEVDSEFFFIGKLINGHQKTFVGVMKMNYSNFINNTNQNQSNLCYSNFSHSIKYLNHSDHQDYYKIAVKPDGSLAYGFSNKFVFVFNSTNSSSMDCWDGQLTWPNTSFIPHAVHLRNDFGVIAGFIENVPGARARYLPIIFLINFNSSNNHPIIVDSHIPNVTVDTWQDLLTNSDANINSAKYDMSVSINDRGYVLVGMEHVNRVFFLSVDRSNPTQLTFVSRFTNGRSLGYGKCVAWLDNGNMAAILANTYSFDYDWQSSQVYIYDMKSGIYNSNSTPLSIFPNYHQRLPKKFSEIFLNIVSSRTSLALVDNDGNVLIFLPTPPGTFPSISKTGSMPLITSEQSCLPGTFKNQGGINDCTLCPTGTRSSNTLRTQCISCSASSFCPLGSSSETSFSPLEEATMIYSYPKSSEVTTVDGVLITNVFGITPGNCRFPPIMIYTVIIGPSLVLALVFIMFIFKYCCTYSKIKDVRKKLEKILKHIDLLGEGEFWLGGALSLALITLITCTYIFAGEFYNLYPIEKGSGSYFACDSALVNAVFESSIKSLGIPQRSEEKKMIDLLNEQNFTLNVDFVNTLVNCDAAALQGLFGTTWLTLRWSNCANVNSTLSISIPLPHQHISVRVRLDDVKTIGGFRIGLYGDEYFSDSYTLKKLYFQKSFYKNGYVLGKDIPLALTLTKVINETVAMEGGASMFSGIFIPTFKVDLDNILLSANQYIFSLLSTIRLEISLTESSYYEKNLQQPMARLSQIIFYSILFTMVCLELLSFVFLLYKILLKPLHDPVIPIVLRSREKSISRTAKAFADAIHAASQFSLSIISPRSDSVNTITTELTHRP